MLQSIDTLIAFLVITIVTSVFVNIISGRMFSAALSSCRGPAPIS